MSSTVKLRKIGNSLGIILPRDVAERLHAADGDLLHIVPETDGVRLTPFDPQFDASLKAFERTRKKYRNALRALAK